MSKYNSRKCSCSQGHIHDSRKEAKRCDELHLMQKAGAISGLETQKRYVLIPAQHEVSGEVYKRGERKGQPKKGRLLEHQCVYIADFDYTENGVHIVEDTKGMKTPDYIIKRKLMLYLHGIRVREV